MLKTEHMTTHSNAGLMRLRIRPAKQLIFALCGHLELLCQLCTGTEAYNTVLTFQTNALIQVNLDAAAGPICT